MSEGPSPAVTLDNCENEPIHVPGAIQPHGVLIACSSPDLTITQVSANVASAFGAPPESVLGHALTEFVDATTAAHLRALGPLEQLREKGPFRVVTIDGTSFAATAHRSDAVFIVELEPSSTEQVDTVGSFDPRLRASLARMQAASDILALTRMAAEEVRAITGFDRVMVYRFDPSWNGEVVAEAKREDLSSFLGMHYPASDIPAQARRLYTVNWIRTIGDVDYTPVPLVPRLDPTTNEPLDLSRSVLRSVSPIHVEYLHNMGVTASVSISLVVDGVLAGLIACHHYAGPRVVPATARDTAEYIGYALSWQIRVLEGAERAERTRAVQQHEAEVVRNIAITSELLDGLDTPAMLPLTDAIGVAVVLEEGIRRRGITPSSEQLRSLVAWLQRQGDDVFQSSHLERDLPEIAGWEDAPGGMLAVTIARELGEYILWFRPAQTRVVNWAGEPVKALRSDGDRAPRLSPRGSFELWQEVVKGRSAPWESWHVDAASSLRRAILGGVRRRAVQLRDINQRLLDADRAKDDFIATVSHELRTPLNAINGWTALLKSGSVDASRVGHALDVIARNVQAQQKLVEDLLDVSRITSGKLTLDVERVDLSAVVASTIEASALAIAAKGLLLHREIDATASHVRGDPMRLRQVVANLLTNAVKFTPKGGTITVRLVREDSDYEISVTDTGQGIDAAFLPHMFEAFRQADAAMNRRSQGLGLGLAIVKKLVELHGGTITAESLGVGQGSTFRVRFPITPFTGTPTADRSSPVPMSPVPRSELAGLRILSVEDDRDSRELIRHMLESCKATVTSVQDAQTALAVLATQEFDFIVSDVGLPEMDGLQFMRQVRSRGSDAAKRAPAVALTAYTRAVDRTAALNAGFQAHVPKPVDPDELIATIISLMGRHRSG